MFACAFMSDISRTAAMGLPEPKPLQQVHHRRHVPSASPTGQHAAVVELAGDRPQAGRAAGTDVRDHRREVPRMLVGISYDSRAERLSAPAGLPE